MTCIAISRKAYKQGIQKVFVGTFQSFEKEMARTIIR